ncbi:MAG: pilus assembly protein PilM [Elusimicrobiota bacterium]
MAQKDKILSLEWNRRTLRAIIAVRSQQVLMVEKLVEIGTGIAPEDDSETEYRKISELLKAFVAEHGLEGSETRVLLPGSQVFVRAVSLPPGSKDELRSMLKFEAEKYIPFAYEEAVIDFYQMDGPGEGKPGEVMMLATRKETVAKHFNIMKDAGITPSMMLVPSVTLEIAAGFTGLAQGAFGILCCGESGWEFDIFMNGKLNMSRVFAYPASGEPADAVDRASREIRTSIMSFNSANPGYNFKEIYLAGPADSVFSKETGKMGLKSIDIDIFRPVKDIVFKDEAAFRSSFLPLTGLLLAGDGKANLVPEEFVRYKEKQRANRNRILISVVTGVLAVIMGIVYFEMHRVSIEENRALLKKVNSSKAEISALEKRAAMIDGIESFASDSLIPLEVLRELSVILPPNVNLIQMVYDHSLNKIDIKGRTNSFNVASLATERMAKSSLFEQVANKGSRSVKMEDKELVDFEITCAVNSRIAGLEK